MSISALNEISQVLGYTPSSIVYDSKFHRFKTAKALDGAYIASEWTFNNRDYSSVTYCDYHGDQVWHTWKSWLEEDFEKKDYQSFKIVWEEKEKEAKKTILETYKEASSGADEFYNKAELVKEYQLYL